MLVSLLFSLPEQALSMIFAAPPSHSAPSRRFSRRLVAKIGLRLNLSPRGASFLVMTLLIASMSCIAALDILSGAHISMRPLLVLPVAAAALFLSRPQLLLLCVVAATLFAYLFDSSLNGAPDLASDAVNWSVAVLTYIVTGELCYQLFLLIEHLHREVVDLRAELRGKNSIFKAMIIDRAQR
jgi:hypothetical protein